MTKAQQAHDAALEALRAHGLTYPGAHLKSPWPTHKDLAVKNKTFVYMGHGGEPLSLSCKLPESHREALMIPGTEPTGYGLGKSGWVSIRFEIDDDIDLEMLKEWIDESYRAQAPKRLIKQLDEGGGGDAKPAKKKVAKKNARKATKKTAAKKANKKKATKKKTAKKAAKKATKKKTAKKATKKKAAKKATKKKAAKKATKKKTARRR